MSLPNILITGTPGTGKTTLARLLEDQLHEQHQLPYQNFNLSQLIKDNNLYETWNQEFDVPEFDEDRVIQYLTPYINQGGVIVDFHTCDIFPQDWFQKVVVLRASNTNIFDRLTERGYQERKITENVECEIFQVVLDEAKEQFREDQVLERQSDTAEEMQSLVEELVSILTS